MVASLESTLVGDSERGTQPTAHVNLEPGAQLGRYALGRVLGVGGMGVVFAAHDTALDRSVAVKVVPEGNDPRGRRRLLREARAMARLDHPNVVKILAVDHCDEHVVIAMELIEGMTLSRWLRAQPRSWRETLHVLVEAGRGLAAAHGAGIMHLDFKPDNVMVADDGRVYVLDFGLARALKSVTAQLRALNPDERPPSIEESATPTHAGGTPRYMAPEQLARLDCDERTDQFSYCVTAIEALYRAHPFPASSIGELVGKISRGVVRRPCPASGIPIRVRNALMRGLAAEPQQRFRTMPELLRILESQLSRRPRYGTALALAGLMAVGAILALPFGADANRADAPPLTGTTTASLEDQAAIDVVGWESNQVLYRRALAQGDLRGAERRARLGLQLARRAGDNRHVQVARDQLADVLSDLDRPDLARTVYESAYFEARDAQDPQGAAQAATKLAELLADSPENEHEARTWMRHAWAQLDRVEDQPSDHRLLRLQERLQTSAEEPQPGLQ